MGSHSTLSTRSLALSGMSLKQIQSIAPDFDGGELVRSAASDLLTLQGQNTPPRLERTGMREEKMRKRGGGIRETRRAGSREEESGEREGTHAGRDEEVEERGPVEVEHERRPPAQDEGVNG
eukprot:760685-Rhodomonas_salina.3